MRSFERARPRVLYVNWVDYLDSEGRGGGVSVYQRSLMAADPDATFIACGTSHDLMSRAPRWERVRHGPQFDRHRRFDLVNSGVLAPGHFSFGDPRQVSDPATTSVFHDFLARQGPFDIVHFNNLEGLPVETLDLGRRFPRTRVVLSLHNHYAVCPQVNLWQDEARNCTDFRSGAACGSCLPAMPQPSVLRAAAGMAYHLKTTGLEPGTRAHDAPMRLMMTTGRAGVRTLRRLRGRGEGPSPFPDGKARAFTQRRAAFVARINASCDVVLCVSDAVRRVATAHGIDPALLRTCRIGTDQSAAWERTAPRRAPARHDGTITAAFLGYMRRDKGFEFLLTAIEALPDALAARLRLRIAARRGDPVLVDRMKALSPRLAALDRRDGYDRAALDDLLNDVDIGIVPVLWEDNLPQVALEMHARHIPLICSDLGGARELGGTEALVFPAGDTAAFAARLGAFMAGAVDLGAYWAGARRPVGMAEHLADLGRIYRSLLKVETRPDERHLVPGA